MGGKVVTLVEIEGADGLQDLGRDIGMHIVAENPQYLNADEVPHDVKEKEKEIARSQVQGKPANMIDKILEGKLKAFYDLVCLLNQKFIKDNSVTVAELVAQKGKELNKPLKVVRFIRWRMGE